MTRRSAVEVLESGYPLYTSLPFSNAKRIVGTETEYGVKKFKESEEKSKESLQTFLPNAGLVYQDNGHHIEWATPECFGALEAALYECAGDTLCQPFAEKLTKNLVDYAGDCWGAHESYSTSISPEKAELFNPLIPFLITRQIIAGAGHFRFDNGLRKRIFRLTQRTPYITDVYAQGTQKGERGIICTRNEKHTSLKETYRFHLIIGDANRSPVAIWLKLGTTQIALDLLERGLVPRVACAYDVKKAREDLHAIDLETSNWKLQGSSVRGMNAIDMQREFLSAGYKHFEGRDEETDDLLEVWQDTLDKLEKDPRLLERRLDWVKKREIVQECIEIAERGGIKYNVVQKDVLLETLDQQYHSVKDPQAEITFDYLYATDQMERLFSPELLTSAQVTPPHRTRARLRSYLLNTFYPDGWNLRCWDTFTFPREMIHPRIRTKTSYLDMGDPFDIGEDIERDIKDQLAREDLIVKLREHKFWPP